MITLHRITDTGSEAYRFVEKLLSAAFPREEYREFAEWRELTACKGIFHNNLICDDGAPVGFISFWDFGRFHYVEHFATLPQLRNRGYGKQVLELLPGVLQTPIVLEAEAPDSDMARRRIGFYRRHGFALWGGEYRQPPYRAGGDWLPMCLMAYGDLPESEFPDVRDTIYREVYGCKAPNE